MREKPEQVLPEERAAAAGRGDAFAAHHDSARQKETRAEQAIGKLFIAGIVPGFVVVAAYSAYILAVAFLQPERVGEARKAVRSAGAAAPLPDPTPAAEMLEDAVVSLITERRTSAPWGARGGAPGAVGENWLLHGGDEARATRLPDKVTVEVHAGDVVRVRTPGGGGWGAPP